MFWPYPGTRALAPVQHCNTQHCSDLNPGFITWDNRNLKIKLMTENWHKPRKWRAEIFPNIAYRDPELTHLQTMKFIRSASKVSVYNLITINNNEINRSPVHFHQKKKDTEGRVVNDLAGVIEQWVSEAGWESGACFLEPYFKSLGGYTSCNDIFLAWDMH